MMKRVLASLLLLALSVTGAFALSQSSVPPKFPIPWGSSAGSSYIRSIPQNSQIGIQNCAASLTDGFPPLTFTPSIAGGCPPDGRDFNGILKQLSLWSQWQGAGAAVIYDSAFSASIGGYPKGTILSKAASVGCFWISIADNNSSDPDTGGANWVGWCLNYPIAYSAAFQTAMGGYQTGAIVASVMYPGGYWRSTTNNNTTNPDSSGAGWTPTQPTPLCGATGYRAGNNAGSPNSKIDITANTALLTSLAGFSVSRKSVSVTLNVAVNGANGLDVGSLTANTVYYTFLIDNGSITASLASLSSTAPTLPSGYVYACRVGSWPTVPTGTNLSQMLARGQLMQYSNTAFLIANGIAGNCSTPLLATEVLAPLPPTATFATGVIGIVGGTEAYMSVQANGLGIGADFTALASSTQTTLTWGFIPVTPVTFFYCSNSAQNSMFLAGWTDSVNVQ